MIDGIVIDTEIQDFISWKATMPFKIITPIDTNTAEIISINRQDNKTGKIYQTVKHIAKFETYGLVINEVSCSDLPVRYYLRISGSLHKNRCKGNNFKRFYFSDICYEINKLCDVLGIDSSRAKILNLEIGVNIHTDFQPHIFLEESLINYKNIPFKQYASDRQNRSLGYECRMKQYWVKCYDKGLQYNLPYNLMRFELKFKVMQILNCKFQIRYLSDLTDKCKVDELKKLLLKSWNNILLYEPVQEGVELTVKQRALIQKGSNAKYWVSLNSTNQRQLYYHKQLFKKIIIQNGNHSHANIKNHIEKEWEKLLEL